jgi:propane monooxygenase large subunit
VMVDQGFVSPDGKTLIPQPHVSFDDKDMWTLDHVKGIEFKSPNVLLNQMTPEQREAHMAEYKQGFTIK